jgi:hypothetical protein
MRKIMLTKLLLPGIGFLLVTALILFWLNGLLGLDYGRRAHLLYETDHKALLEACRELAGRVRAGTLTPRMYGVRAAPDPEASTFPTPILDLKPNYVVVGSDGSVVVAVGGGFDAFGVKAYPENYKEPPFQGFKLGDKKLLDGLWYYDDGYEEMGPDYDKRIEALRPRKQSD